MNIEFLFTLIAFVCFIAGAAGVGFVNWISLGLAFWVLTLLT